MAIQMGNASSVLGSLPIPNISSLDENDSIVDYVLSCLHALIIVVVIAVIINSIIIIIVIINYYIHIIIQLRYNDYNIHVQRSGPLAELEVECSGCISLYQNCPGSPQQQEFEVKLKRCEYFPHFLLSMSFPTAAPSLAASCRWRWEGVG